MNPPAPKELTDGGGATATFRWDERPAAWCYRDFRLKYDGYNWTAMLITYAPSAGVYSKQHEDPQAAFDDLCRILRRCALAAGVIK